MVKEEGEEVEELTLSTFKEKVKKGTRWLISFYAPWCGFSKRLKPEFAKVAKTVQENWNKASPPPSSLSPTEAEQQRDKVVYKVGKIDADKEADLAGLFGVQHLPTIYLIQEGKYYKFQGRNEFLPLLTFFEKDFISSSALLLPSPLLDSPSPLSGSPSPLLDSPSPPSPTPLSSSTDGEEDVELKAEDFTEKEK